MYQPISRLLDLPKSTSQKQKQFHAWLKNKDWPAIEAVVNDKLNEQEEKMVKNWLNQALFKAAQNQDITLMTYLLCSPNLKRHANINTRNKVCWVLACYHGNMDMVRFLSSSSLLSHHNALDSKNDHALITAIAHSNKELLNYLLEEKNKNLWSNYEEHEKFLYQHVIFAANLDKWDMLGHLLKKPNVRLEQIKKEIIFSPDFSKKEKVLDLISSMLEKKSLTATVPLSFKKKSFSGPKKI